MTMISSTEKKRICLASPDIHGPKTTDSVGRFCTDLAHLWVKDGHEVTLLYVHDANMDPTPMEPWIAHYADLGIEFVPCPKEVIVSSPHPLGFSWYAYQWLKDRSFDLIVFPDSMGVGLFSQMAKDVGLCFQSTTIAIAVQAPTIWEHEANRQLPHALVSVVADSMERRSVALADILVSPNTYMLDYLRREEWSLPADLRVIPNPSADALITRPSRSDTGKPVQEIVYFNALTERGGLKLFLKALSLMDPARLENLKVTFLGQERDFPGGAQLFLEQNRHPAIGEWQIITDLDRAGAVEYLSHPGRLAVIPSTAESNSPGVQDCLDAGIPFIASHLGGIPEMIAPAAHAIQLFEPVPIALAAHLGAVLDHLPGPVAPALPKDATRKAWSSLALEKVEKIAAIDLDKAADAPLVSIVLITRNRPKELEEALVGLRAQTWPHLEVILVDDGSDRPDAIRKLDHLEAEFAARKWRIIRQQNRYLGAARNTGWTASSGAFIIFHDDDNVSMPELVSTYVKAMHHSASDVATCALVPFSGAVPTRPMQEEKEIWTPIGDSAGAGFFLNLYGDAHACFRRDALERLGGFSEDFGLGHEDWEIFAKAQLAGMKILSVPAPLFRYRVSEDSMLRARLSPDADYRRSLRPFLAGVPGFLRLSMAYGLKLGLDEIERFKAEAKALAEERAKAATEAETPAEERIMSDRTDDPIEQVPIAGVIFSDAQLQSLALAALPKRLRSVDRLRDAVTGRLCWQRTFKRHPFAIGEIMTLRKLNRIDAAVAEEESFDALLLSALPDDIGSFDRVRELAAFKVSWLRILTTYPWRIRYWQAARRIQRESRRILWSGPDLPMGPPAIAP